MALEQCHGHVDFKWLAQAIRISFFLLTKALNHEIVSHQTMIFLSILLYKSRKCKSTCLIFAKKNVVRNYLKANILAAKSLLKGLYSRYPLPSILIRPLQPD